MNKLILGILLILLLPTVLGEERLTLDGDIDLIINSRNNSNNETEIDIRIEINIEDAIDEIVIDIDNIEVRNDSQRLERDFDLKLNLDELDQRGLSTKVDRVDETINALCPTENGGTERCVISYNTCKEDKRLAKENEDACRTQKTNVENNLTTIKTEGRIKRIKLTPKGKIFTKLMSELIKMLEETNMSGT